MTSSFGNRINKHERLRKLTTLALVAAIGLFVIQTAWKALRAPWLVEEFPDALYVKVELMPWIFPAHMIAGGLALVMVPLMIMLSRHRRWHRLLAWATVPVVLVAGLTAFPVALIAPVTAVSGWGFAAQGAVWLALLGTGIWHVRHGRLAQHRRAMLLMAATTSGAVFFRIYLALFALVGHPRDYRVFYAADAWLAWTLPLAAMAFFLKWSGAKPSNPQ
ncbi:MAG: DUF2306 domain-containing protein [Sphingomonadales bacterium]|nr:DUF2306 domain-containing protein [Sphingomonadales bacterium]